MGYEKRGCAVVVSFFQPKKKIAVFFDINLSPLSSTIGFCRKIDPLIVYASSPSILPSFGKMVIKWTDELWRLVDSLSKEQTYRKIAKWLRPHKVTTATISYPFYTIEIK